MEWHTLALPVLSPQGQLASRLWAVLPIPGSHCSPLRVRRGRRKISITTRACALPRRVVPYQTAPTSALGPSRTHRAEAAQRGAGNTWREPVLTSQWGTLCRNGELDSPGIKMLVLKLTSTPCGERHEQPYVDGQG